MHCTDLITSLPSRLSCIVLQDWLNLKSVMVLDSAYCCHRYRQDFLDLMQSDEYIIHEELNIRKVIEYKYLLKRFGEKIRSVLLEKELACVKIPSLVKYCHSLTHVSCYDIDRNMSKVLTIIENNAQIEHLCLYGKSSKFFLGILTNVISLPKLNTLALIDSTIPEHGMLNAMWFGNNIIRLDLSGSFISHASLVSIPQMCPNLTSLGLANTQLTDEVLSTITASCPHIVKLDIANNYILSDGGILSMVQNLNALQTLNVIGVRRITGAALKHIYTHCAATLHTFYINHDGYDGPRFEHAGVHTMLVHCPQLRRLHFEASDVRVGVRAPPSPKSAVNSLTTLVLKEEDACDYYLMRVAKHALNLEVLYVSHPKREALMCLFAGGCPKLRELYVAFALDGDEEFNEDLNGLAFFAMDVWMKFRPGLRITQCTKENLGFKAM